MDPITWDRAWATGHSAIDYDHQMLVNITNEVIFARRNPKVRNAEMKRVLGSLVDYVSRHFRREEEIFMKSKYPKKEAHLAMHRELEQVVGDIVDVFNREPDLLNLDEVVTFLRRWLIDHILKHDMGYKQYLV